MGTPMNPPDSRFDWALVYIQYTPEQSVIWMHKPVDEIGSCEPIRRWLSANIAGLGSVLHTSPHSLIPIRKGLKGYVME